jgi:hypothetical protein
MSWSVKQGKSKMVKLVIKAQKVDKIWGDMSEDRGFEGRHNISDEDWVQIRLYLEAAYDAGYSEGLDQGAEDAEWEASSRNGFDGRSPDDGYKKESVCGEGIDQFVFCALPRGHCGECKR